MRIVAVPNWSIYDPAACDHVRQLGSEFDVQIHYVQGDPDHQRTVTAFSGQVEAAFAYFRAICDYLLPKIDLSNARGVHPRSGALDVAPFVCLEGSESELILQVRELGFHLKNEYGLAGYFYEKAAYPGHEIRLPVLRGQMGERPARFDFGEAPHPKWGYTVMGVRDFLLAANINLDAATLTEGKALAKHIRDLREAGDPRFTGVRALAFWLESKQAVQLSFNLTRPDLTSFNDICSYCITQHALIRETELIGVIHKDHLSTSTQLAIKPEQVVR